LSESVTRDIATTPKQQELRIQVLHIRENEPTKLTGTYPPQQHETRTLIYHGAGHESYTQLCWNKMPKNARPTALEKEKKVIMMRAKPVSKPDRNRQNKH